MTSREQKPLIYSFMRLGHFEQLVKFCDNITKAKGKEPVSLFWKAVGMASLGRTEEALQILEQFQQKKDLMLPVTLAQIYAIRKSARVDKDALEAYSSSLSIGKDLVKDAGMVLAARLALYANDFDAARGYARELVRSGFDFNRDIPESPYEWEAVTIDLWCALGEVEFEFKSLKELSISSDFRRLFTDSLEQKLRGSRLDSLDADLLFASSRCKRLMGLEKDAFSMLNQVIAMHPWYTPALVEKASLLAVNKDWEQALEVAQRIIDVEPHNLTAHQIIAVHSITQEANLNDSLSKLEDFDNALANQEVTSVSIAMENSALFSRLCMRHPRVLQICAQMVERAYKNVRLSGHEEAKVLCELGRLHLLQGKNFINQALKEFQLASKNDPANVDSLEGQVRCQLLEGQYEDAMQQIDLVMLNVSSNDELPTDFSLIKAILAKVANRNMDEHLDLIKECRDLHASRLKNSKQASSLFSWGFYDLLNFDPDLILALAVEFLCHLEAISSIPITQQAVEVVEEVKEEVSKTAVMMSMTANNKNNTMIYNTIIDGTNADASSGGANKSSNQSANNLVLSLDIHDSSPSVQAGVELLSQLVLVCPGCVSAYVELARCYLAQKKYEEATRTLQRCPLNSAILVHLAKVDATQTSTSAANRSLEQALASDFALRNSSLFRLMQIYVKSQQGKFDESITDIEQLLRLPEFKNMTSGADTSSDSDGNVPFSSHTDPLRITDDDKVGAYIAQASLLSKCKRHKEAQESLSIAKVMFSGTAQEVQVLVASSQLAVERKDYDAAIRMLDKISEDSSIFEKAQKIKADILLTCHRDKEGYTQCFVRLVEQKQSAKNLGLLGDAYLRILNPEAAVQSLLSAYELDPHDSKLRSKIGRVLIATHDYHRAIEFYENAIRKLTQAIGSKSGSLASSSKLTAEQQALQSDALMLSHQLARLYSKLNHFERAGRILSSMLHENNTRDKDFGDMRTDVTTLLLLADIQKLSNSNEQLDTLNKAVALQKLIVSNNRMSASSEGLEKDKQTFSDIYTSLGFAFLASGNKNGAQDAFNDALSSNLNNTRAMLGLAKLYRLRGEIAQCQAQCSKIVLIDPANEDGAVLLAEVTFSTTESEAAIKPLHDLLVTKPNNYVALEKMIVLLRRAGRLQDDAPAYLTAAEKADVRFSTHAGYHFCQGLYARYTNDIGKAIAEFNLARRDEAWGVETLSHMIELYLNPDQEGAWDETQRDSSAIDETMAQYLKAAETLLGELEVKAKGSLKFKVLEAYYLLATRQKSNIDKAMQTFIAILEKEPDYLPANLGLATGFMVEKNENKARTLLKKVCTAKEMLPHDGEDFTKANLLLAKFYVDKSKYDLAQDLCQRCLSFNKSSSQAWEISGLVYEKTSEYDRAAECYGKAWKLESSLSAPVGFKLAFSLLKCKRHVESIDVCETVLTQYPDYPKIRDEILKKAQIQIRTKGGQ